MDIRSLLLATHLPKIFPINTLVKGTNQNFILPFYHIVSDENVPHVKHLYRIKNSKKFESDLDFLLKNYLPISANDLSNVINGNYTSKKIMLLTFDDGLRESAEVIAPILLRKGIPAVFFLNSDFIDNKELMFRYKISLLIDKLQSPEIKKQLLSYRKDNSFIQSMADEMSFSFQEYLKEEKPYLSSEQVKSLINKEFSIGAHSCNHPYYEDISLPEQISQTIKSLDFLQTNFDVKEKLFAFPFTDYGVKKDFFDEIFKNDSIQFSFGGAGMKQDVSVNHFQRIAMESPSASAADLIKTEYLYYLLKMPFGKNKITRA